MSVMSGLCPILKGFLMTFPLAPFSSGRTGTGSNWLKVELAVESAILQETSAVHFPAIDFVEAGLTLATARHDHQMQNSD